MKYSVRLFWLLILVALAPCLFAADLTGTWKGNFDFQGVSVPITLHLIASGDAITGTVERPNVPAATIHDGTVTNEDVSFWINANYDGTSYRLVFRGTIAGDQVKFVFGTEDGGWGSKTVVRRAAVSVPLADASGIWKGLLDFHGHSVPLTFRLNKQVGVVTGTVDGFPAGSSEIHEGTVDGESLRFSVVTVFHGSPVKLIYKGKVAGAEIKFSFGTEDGSWGTEMTAAKI